MVAAKQRDDAADSLEEAALLIEKAQDLLDNARDSVPLNPVLGEAQIADTSRLTARALMQVERVLRLLTEAGIGRE
jgi:hypothetical protein